MLRTYTDLKESHYRIAKPPDTPIQRMMGTIVSVEPLTKSCTIYVRGEPIPIPMVRYVSSYYPVPNETVWIDRLDGDMLIIGSHSHGDGQSYTTTLVGMSPGLNGQIYHRTGMWCDVQFNFQWTGTSGTGVEFGWNLPFPVSNDMLRTIGVMNFTRNTGAHVPGTCFAGAATTLVKMVGPGGVISGNFGLGFAVTANDSVVCSMRFKVAPGF